MLGRSFRSKLRTAATSRRCFTSGAGTLSRLSVGGANLVEGGYYAVQRFQSTSRFAYPEGMKAYEDDWTEEAEYPEITEQHTWNEHRRKRLQDRLNWHARIKNAGCPEVKNFEWNMPKKYGYKVFQINEECFEYDCLNAYKFITRTHVASTSELPSQYSSPELNEKVEYFKNKLKEPLMDVLSFELDIPRHYEHDFNALPQKTDYKKSQTIIPQINRVILNALGKEVDYLKDCQVDRDPNVEAFWHLGGCQPSSARRGKRKGSAEAKGLSKARYIQPDDPVEENIHYVGKPLLQVRCKNPPENFLHPADPLCQRSEEIPDRYPHFLEAYGIRRPVPYSQRFASFIPGHWSGDLHRCNLLAYHPRHHLAAANRADNPYWSAKEEVEEALQAQAMLVSFGRLVSQALYHGYDQFTDLDYPFSTQTVITNGLDWSFFTYQLNTMKLDELSIAKKPKQNVLWATQTQSIFDPEKKGLNDSVLSNLLRFYLNPPQPIASQNPTPYLTTRIQDWGEKERDPTRVQKWTKDKEGDRVLTYFNYRDMISQRIYRTDSLFMRRPPEIQEYEYIYKIYFQAMPLDKPLKHFELPSGFPGSNPYNEPYQIRDPTYESKGVRRLREEVAKRKEEEAIEAAKVAEALKYGVTIDRSKKKK